MQLSIHYYVLSLSEQTSRIYEGFRNKLIDIEDTCFPFESSINAATSASNDIRLRKFLHQTDLRFAHYYDQDPHRLVVTGEKRNLAIFKALTTHHDAFMGTVEGDFSDTSPHDLGKIVWPVVKENMAGATKNAMRDLATATKVKKVVSGIDAVGQSAESETGSTLYVEDDYHMKGSIHKMDHSVIYSKHVNLLEVIDDVVDVIIEKVLKMDGTVIFLNSGSLVNFERIALILQG